MPSSWFEVEARPEGGSVEEITAPLMALSFSCQRATESSVDEGVEEEDDDDDDVSTGRFLRRDSVPTKA